PGGHGDRRDPHRARPTMTPEEAFQRAIRDNPADPGPWLMYADWLEERGSPLAAVYRQREGTNSIGMRFVLVPRGSFLMGSPGEQPGRKADEGPQHEVAITRPFYLGAFPVTQAEFRRVMGRNPSWPSGKGFRRARVRGLDPLTVPVDRASWDGAVRFCQLLPERGWERRAVHTYRLPTEAEWEYACREAGAARAAYHFGATAPRAQANFGGWEDGGFVRGRPIRVGAYPPNRLGLYDMHGNVAEFCSDYYDPEFYCVSPREDPRGPEKSSSEHGRVMRGGG